MPLNLELLGKLAEGYSTQAKTANRYWFALALGSMIGLAGNPDPNTMRIDLPFGLGSVHTCEFYPLMLVLIGGLVIAYSSAMKQAIIARNLTQKYIDGLTVQERTEGNIGAHALFDNLVTPTFNRVAPLVYWMIENGRLSLPLILSKTSKILSILIYCIFKFISWGFIYILPVVALYKCWNNLDCQIDPFLHIPHFVLVIVMSAAGFGTVTMLGSDLIYMVKVIKHLWKKKS